MANPLARISRREQAILLFAALVAIGIGSHALLIEPYQLRMAELGERIEQERADLSWMAAAVAELPAGGAAASGTRITGSLANFVDQAVRRQGLGAGLAQMSPIGADEVRTRFTSVEFNRLLALVAALSQAGLDVRDLRVSAKDDPGRVDASIVLVRS